MGLDIG